MEIKSTLRRIQLIIALGGIVVLSGMIVTGCGGGRLSVSSSQFQVQESPQYELETEVTGIAEQRLDDISGQEELPGTQNPFSVFISRIYTPDRPEYRYTEEGGKNPYANYVGQCIWYVFGRIQESEVGLPSFLRDYDKLKKIFGNARAKEWDDRAREAAKLAGLPGLELKIGSRPRPKSIAVWESSHVAFVENDRGQVTESNYVRADGSFNPGNDAEVVIHGDPGSDQVKIYSKIGDVNHIGSIHRYAIACATKASGSWYYLELREGRGSGQTKGWAQQKVILRDSNGNPIVWNFTRIRRRPSDLGGGRPQPDCYIYLNVPEIPQLSSPSNGATNVSINPTLRWNSVKRATSYQIEVARDQNFTTIVFRTSTTSTSAQVNGLARNTRYWWRVKALNDDGSSPWSNAWYFTTQR